MFSDEKMSISITIKKVADWVVEMKMTMFKKPLLPVDTGINPLLMLFWYVYTGTDV